MMIANNHRDPFVSYACDATPSITAPGNRLRNPGQDFQHHLESV